MADNTTLVQTIISGVLSGGTSAATAFAAVFRDIKKRLLALETKVGSDEDPHHKTGLLLGVDRLDEGFRKLKREIENWEEDPPEWIIKIVSKAARSTSINLEHYGELQHVIETKHKQTTNRMSAMDERFDDYITQKDYERDNRERLEELAKIREQLATSNGLLRGVMSALGYVEPQIKKRPGP